jgi:LuxR family maltose regulon positive regulatory protein
VGAEHSAEHALALMREIGSLKGIVQCLYLLVQFTIMKGELEAALALVEEIRDLADETNSLDGKMLSAGSLSFLVSIMDENYTDGAALAQKNYTLSLEPFFGWNFLVAAWGQAVVACGLGQYEAVRREYSNLIWDRRDDPAIAALCLAVEAAALAHEGKLERAAEMLGLALNLPPWASGWLHRWALLDRLRADLASRLGEAAFGAAWERGCALDVEATMRTLVHGDAAVQPTATHPDMIEPLSDREREVLGLIVDGLSNRDIAERLVLSVGTVKVHARNIYGKLNVSSRTQAIAQANRYNLL